ncbi:hypothetical protein ACFPZ0_15140 [Streptomonospora nanhaiensis]|uniref:Uncharacterized protein n=1 Tax=Streptomonospora nanhaiensis TaxID=1323731 RepID=A0A853BFG7_9ACTN|nr:hypothetical protein [Streptomonospora nanhaiensis]MBX9390425.1 hypothetical protein [Streptomonospora nanhaiensis]NYI94198.1 hypothetical protein [Streptomonospora nanhaiensis]
MPVSILLLDAVLLVLCAAFVLTPRSRLGRYVSARFEDPDTHPTPAGCCLYRVVFAVLAVLIVYSSVRLALAAA